MSRWHLFKICLVLGHPIPISKFWLGIHLLVQIWPFLNFNNNCWTFAIQNFGQICPNQFETAMWAGDICWQTIAPMPNSSWGKKFRIEPINVYPIKILSLILGSIGTLSSWCQWNLTNALSNTSHILLLGQVDDQKFGSHYGMYWKTVQLVLVKFRKTQSPTLVTYRYWVKLTTDNSAHSMAHIGKLSSLS